MAKILNKHAMIDIETLGTRPGAPVLSIGVVWFDPEANGWVPRHKGFYVRINFEDVCTVMKDGIDPSTIAWWLAQSDAAREELTREKGTVPIKAGLEALSSFLLHHSECPETKDIYVWGNDDVFDIGLLNAAYDAVGVQVPWRYNRPQNVRTVVWMADVLCGMKRPKMTEGTEHNALDDARHQAEYVTDMVRAIKAGERHDTD